MPGSELTRGGGAAPGKGEGGTYTAQTEGVGGDHTQDPEGEPTQGQGETQEGGRDRSSRGDTPPLLTPVPPQQKQTRAVEVWRSRRPG